MTIQIESAERKGTGYYFTATANKVSALVCIYSHGFQIICKNASHRVWRGSGRHFHTLNDALDHYRSPEMRAIINEAVNLSKAA